MCPALRTAACHHQNRGGRIKVQHVLRLLRGPSSRMQVVFIDSVVQCRY